MTTQTGMFPEQARSFMIEFSESTGISSNLKPRRYLWTDAFAVCNFLELHRRTGERSWLRLALGLVDQVHRTLGRHREDDPRSGWISGLDEQEGGRHPTAGGLRIGKRLNERRSDEPLDETTEWDRDGQYYHYLTKWMHALDQVSRHTGEPIFNRWARELAKSAHSGFVHVSPWGLKRMYWKLSIDMSYPLVLSMGQHDPLDGLITCAELQYTAASFEERHGPSLASEIADMTELSSEIDWPTGDPLGIGGLLSDAYRIEQLIPKSDFVDTTLLAHALDAAAASLHPYAASRSFGFPAEYRLAFRELGTAIGLHAVEKMEAFLERHPAAFSGAPSIPLQIESLKRYIGLAETIENFWLQPSNRESPSWIEHQDINRVMLATSLAPDAYLDISE